MNLQAVLFLLFQRWLLEAQTLLHIIANPLLCTAIQQQPRLLLETEASVATSYDINFFSPMKFAQHNFNNYRITIN